jgi:hypothetical protein
MMSLEHKGVILKTVLIMEACQNLRIVFSLRRRTGERNFPPSAEGHYSQ